MLLFQQVYFIIKQLIESGKYFGFGSGSCLGFEDKIIETPTEIKCLENLDIKKLVCEDQYNVVLTSNLFK
jgi:hypothetical protein